MSAASQADRPLRAAVIGLGRIGAGLDRAASTSPLTHAGAYAAHPEFSLAAVCDVDPDRCRAEARRYGAAPYLSAAEMMDAVRPDVVSVCTPTPDHAATLRAVLAVPPKCVVMEKPLAPDLDTAQAMAEACELAGVPLVVHFTRRFIPLYEEVRRRILAGSRVVSASIKYAKGLRHNGSHAVALAMAMFGGIQEVRPLAARHDAFPDDPTVALHLRCERCDDVHLQALDERLFTHFEFDVILDDGRYTFYKDDTAALRYDVVWNEVYACPSLRPAGEIPTGKERAMLELAGHAAACARGLSAPRCDGRFALAVQALCETVIERVTKDEHAGPGRH